jgi:predicted P-loop ATPase
MGGYIAGGLLAENEVENRLKNTWIERDFDSAYNYEKTILDGINDGKNSPITLEQFSSQIKKNNEDKSKFLAVMQYARELNRSGQKWNGHHIINLCEQYLIKKEKVEQIFKDVFEKESLYFDFDNKTKPVKTEIVIADKWEFRRNTVTQSTDYRIRQDKNSKFERVNYDTVTRYALHCGQTTSPDKIKSLLRSDFVPEYDPLKTFFLNLNAWDEKTDYIQQLASHVQTDNDEFFQSMFKKHLVRSIAQIFSGKINRYVFVLVGEKQASGKSTFIRNLSPFDKAQYYTESKVRDDKDGQFAFAENFIYNIEELSDMKNTDVNRLKAMISQAIIKERKPYAAEVESIPRRCSFFGSTNNAQFLTDTENTRWICNNVINIDWNYTKIDISDVWAQAFALWHGKVFDDQLTALENVFQSNVNKDYEVSDVGKELISKYFQPVPKEHDKAMFFTIADIVEILTHETNGNVKFNDRIIGKNLTQLNFIQGRKRINGNGVRGYFARKIVGQYVEIDEIEIEGSNENNNLPF